MHHEAYDFLKRVKAHLPKYFTTTKVLECGAIDINGDKYGSNRKLFVSPQKYVGVDLGPGKGVDLVCKTHEIPAIHYEVYDIVFSTEMLEHDPWSRFSVATMLKCLKHKGLFILTVAGLNRPEHGTSTTNPKDSPFLADTKFKDFYKGFDYQKLRDILDTKMFTEFGFEYRREGMDLYFWGIKR
jgi:SAM-dependent methyltransferase